MVLHPVKLSKTSYRMSMAFATARDTSLADDEKRANGAGLHTFRTTRVGCTACIHVHGSAPVSLMCPTVQQCHTGAS